MPLSFLPGTRHDPRHVTLILLAGLCDADRVSAEGVAFDIGAAQRKRVVYRCSAGGSATTVMTASCSACGVLGDDGGVASRGDVERDRAAQLLAGPRGRDVCAETAVLVDSSLEWPFDPTDRKARDDFIDRLSAVDVAFVAALADPLALIGPLASSVASAMYWQEPDEEDMLLETAEVVAALEPVARALSSAPAAAWWWSPLDVNQQAIVRWLEPGRRRASRPQLTGTSARLLEWRSSTIAEEARAAREWPTAHDASYSGPWWSTPVHVNVTTTSRHLGRLPAVQLELVEDSLGWDAARVAAVEILLDCRVLELETPSDWVDLVERYPLDVDRSRRHDWWRATGGTGPWQIPDWPAVGQDYDAVHLTVMSYLAGAGRALPTRSGQTVLAGFDPDLTFWLNDSLTQAAPPSSWRRTDSDSYTYEWIRDPTAA